jgi:hypothetical protein
MTPETVKQVIEDTIKVRELAKAYLNLSDRDRVTGTRVSGALRRASMDLTRSLADMRRPG